MADKRPGDLGRYSTWITPEEMETVIDLLTQEADGLEFDHDWRDSDAARQRVRHLRQIITRLTEPGPEKN